MSDARERFVYTIWIATTPERVFAALSDAELTKQYWGVHKNVSDWKVGSRWAHVDYDDPSKVAVVGKVLEYDPPKKMVVSWARPANEEQPEKHSRVTYLVEPQFGAVKLTLVHEELAPGPATQMVTSGWPAILSSMKTLLESGSPMPMTTRRWGGQGV